MKTSCGKFLNLAHYFLYDVKLRLLAHSRSFLANQNARNAIVGAENLLIMGSPFQGGGGGRISPGYFASTYLGVLG